MKRRLLYALPFILVLVALFFWDFSGVAEEKTEEIAYGKVCSIVGDSMSPTLKPGDCAVVDPTRQAKVGEIAMFQCFNVCKGGNYDGSNQSHALFKRVTKIREDGAWWVQGDNQPDSWDSIDYGWILPSQRTDVGVVVEILK